MADLAHRVHPTNECSPPPPDIVKQGTVKEYARQYDLNIFIETGTYRGDMVGAVKNVFDEIYSIELGIDLFRQAQRRFRRFKHITIRQGNSGDVLKEILHDLNQPCLYWLDAHYSGGVSARGDEDSPVRAELGHIFKHPMASTSIILIDDAICFTGESGYPTIQNVKDIANAEGFDASVMDNIIRIVKQ